jgi:transposase-like protein
MGVKHKTPPDIRAAAVEMVEKGGKLREVAQAFKVSHETVRQWAKDARAARQAAPADKPAQAKGTTGPVYVGGERLGRLALWK